MKKAYMILASAIAATVAAFGYVAIGVDGVAIVSQPCRVVGAEASVATNASCAATLTVVKSITRVWEDVSVSTNVTITRMNAEREFVATNVETHLVASDGFRYIAVNTPLSVTNIVVGVGTNVMSVATNNVAFRVVTNSVPYKWSISTNRWFYPYRTIATVVTTNRTPVISRTPRSNEVAVTNTICTVNLANGFGTTNVTNGAWLKNGDRIIGSGTAFDKGGTATVYAE